MTDILPPPSDPNLQEIHDRSYVVRAYRMNDKTILLRGAVRDEKPAGLYIPDDPEPLPLHHMVVALTVTMPEMIITEAEVEFEVYPHGGCPAITAHYKSLIGLSIARGFTHKVRELFGGPRGCTHTTALLQAMAPVAIQSVWSMRAVNVAEGSAQVEPEPTTREERLARMRFNLNTCHIWDENGEQAKTVADGGDIGLPIWITDRYAKLGRDPMEWRKGMGGG
ncbi:MAG: DUF2889 domain-containing protein [Ilumatobacteraceae bacterium]|jgi:Protein of unknown function (DUF2889)|nr:DUF2889 domain-containing protein [Ilumatobacteraceae bacterium]